MEVDLATPQFANLGLIIPKLANAKRLLKLGFTAVQVGSRMKLSAEQVEALQVVVDDIELQPSNETHEQWRARMAKEMETLAVGIAGKQMRALDTRMLEHGVNLDKDSMGTIVDASAIAHKWLRSGEEGSKTTISLNFSALAQAAPDSLANGHGQVYEIATEEMQVATAEEPIGSDDWLD